MIPSKRVEKMLSPYGWDDVMTFLHAYDIYYFIDAHGHMSPTSVSGIRANGRDYRFDKPNTLFFIVEKDNPYGPFSKLIVFEHTEEQLINKFERFIKMKAFL
jgi:hypothetical protein